jgi:hypothetical protein
MPSGRAILEVAWIWSRRASSPTCIKWLGKGRPTGRQREAYAAYISGGRQCGGGIASPMAGMGTMVVGARREAGGSGPNDKQEHRGGRTGDGRPGSAQRQAVAPGRREAGRRPAVAVPGEPDKLLLAFPRLAGLL